MRSVFLVAAALCLALSILLSSHTFSTLFSSPTTPQLDNRREMVASSKHALVVGASSGIGLGVAQEVAPLVAKLTLCSRSLPTDLLASIKAKNPDIEVVHERLDVSLLHEVRKFTTKHADTQFDWIVLSPGIMTMNGRTETAEGLDVKMSTHYYGRYDTLQPHFCICLHDLRIKRKVLTSFRGVWHGWWEWIRFMLVHDLLAGLNRPGVRVLNVLSAGSGGAPDLDDLDLKRSYSVKRCADVTTMYS
ncbi:hypothetical protein BBJ28_00007870 [Nothophytophthora sp. Chile5]|nr:hypothetical protein BBJ28_00007870 [Nothophytophthora sp. Chile5]